MGRIRVLSDHVANKIAAGEVVERPASIVKELLENAIDAGAQRIRVTVDAGGKKLIQIVDDGTGMGKDDALLAFERHATSKIHDVDDLLSIASLGFRGEALPSIAAVSRLTLETRVHEEPSGSIVEIAGGKLLKVTESGLPVGTSIAVRDLFFNTPARKKFLKSEATELSYIASLVTHYALAHPAKHFELQTPTSAMLVATPVPALPERIYQVFGAEMLEQLIPVAAVAGLERAGIPEPPPWRRERDYRPPDPGSVRLHGFVSKPELQKLNRNSMYVFVNGRLIRDRLVQHGLAEAYRNVMPPAVFPVVLLFLELPPCEVDVNVHPSKTEVRFRQQSFLHDFVRDSVRAALMRARPLPGFTREIHAQPTATPALSSPTWASVTEEPTGHAEGSFTLRQPDFPAGSGVLEFAGATEISGNATVPVIGSEEMCRLQRIPWWGPPTRHGAPSAPGERQDTEVGADGESNHTDPVTETDTERPSGGSALASLRPVGQVSNSFILAVNSDGLWIIDQHVAHERVLFERVVRQRLSGRVEGQRLLMPMIVELTPGQQAAFTEIAQELRLNGFDIEPFGSRSIAVKTAPSAISADSIERMLQELLEEFEREHQRENLEKIQTRIAASIACHAAIKINTPLEQKKMEWLLAELAQTECPMSCPHGRPIVLRYSVRDIQKAFKRI